MTDTTTTNTALVTGASRGIGRAVAVELGRLGWNVAINYNANADAAREAAALVEQAGGKAIIQRADVGNLADHAELLDAAVAAFGPVTLLVNNAGVAPRVRADMLQMSEDSYDFVMDTNLKGTYFLTQRVANHMIESGIGSDAASPSDSQSPIPPAIVTISSISAYAASVNRAEYCIAKAGLAMLTKVFAARLAEHGINVYEIRPGIIMTDMTGPVKAKYDKLILEDGLTPIRRWGQPQDVANAVAAIAQGRLPFSTGEVLNVDGGFHLKTL